MSYQLEPSERKLLFVFVREALARPGEDSIDTAKRNTKIVEKLRALGFIAPSDDSLTKEAFLAYFETFEEMQCPKPVEDWVHRLNVSDLRWRRPSGFMLSQMAQGFGKTYPPLATIFIGENAFLRTWFHELGHVVYPRIDKERVSRLVTATKLYFPVVSSDRVSAALDPTTLKATTLPKGIYLKMNGQFYGLDHSGPGANAENDELWAILFGEYCSGFELPPSVLAILEEIIGGLTTDRAHIP